MNFDVRSHDQGYDRALRHVRNKLVHAWIPLLDKGELTVERLQRFVDEIEDCLEGQS